MEAAAVVPVPEPFSVRVIRARYEMGLSRTAFAKRLGVSLNTIKLWETGQIARPRAAHVMRLSEVTRKSVGHYVDGLDLT